MADTTASGAPAPAPEGARNNHHESTSGKGGEARGSASMGEVDHSYDSETTISPPASNVVHSSPEPEDYDSEATIDAPLSDRAPSPGFPYQSASNVRDLSGDNSANEPAGAPSETPNCNPPISPGGNSPPSSPPSSPPAPTSELQEIDHRARLRALYGSPCACTGWCTCQRYLHFFATSTYPGLAKNAPGDEIYEGKEVKGGVEVPSQTHLTEWALAAEESVVSAVRSTVGLDLEERKRTWEEMEGDVGGNVDRKRSWDGEGVRPARAPRSWAGGVWKGMG